MVPGSGVGGAHSTLALVQLRTTVGSIPLRAALGLWEDGGCESLHRCSYLSTFGQKIPSGILQASQETSGTMLPFPILVTWIPNPFNSFLHPLSHCLCFLILLSGVTVPIKYLYLSPFLRLCFEGNTSLDIQGYRFSPSYGSSILWIFQKIVEECGGLYRRCPWVRPGRGRNHCCPLSVG